MHLISIDATILSSSPPLELLQKHDKSTVTLLALVWWLLAYVMQHLYLRCIGCFSAVNTLLNYWKKILLTWINGKINSSYAHWHNRSAVIGTCCPLPASAIIRVPLLYDPSALADGQVRVKLFGTRFTNGANNSFPSPMLLCLFRGYHQYVLAHEIRPHVKVNLWRNTIDQRRLLVLCFPGWINNIHR